MALELVHCSDAAAAADVAAAAAPVAAAAQDTRKFCTEASILKDAQKKHVAVMTIFCHPEGFQSQTYVDQTSRVNPLLVPIQQLKNLKRTFQETLISCNMTPRGEKSNHIHQAPPELLLNVKTQNATF